MSARDAESGSSTYRGGSGRAGGLGNGGLGGGMGAGMGGGGAARNGGYGNRTGLTTGNTMFGGMAFGRPGGFALNSSAFGVRPQPKVTQGPLNSGLLGTPTPAAVPGVNPASEDVLAVEEVPPYTPNVFSGSLPTPGNLSGWYSQNIAGLMPNKKPTSIQGPGAVGPTGYYMKNPTGYPQWTSGWKNQTNNYSLGNTFPGGLNFTTGNFTEKYMNDDTRYGIDKMARGRGY